MTDDLVAFLRARLDEDEQTARAASLDEDQEQGNHWRWGRPDSPAPTVRDGMLRGNAGLSADVALCTVEEYAVEGCSRLLTVEILNAARAHAEPAEHIARHDPARVLAEIDAKRRIIAECESAYDQDSRGMAWMADRTLELLALPHRDHPDYRPEWAPEV